MYVLEIVNPRLLITSLCHLLAWGIEFLVVSKPWSCIKSHLEALMSCISGVSGEWALPKSWLINLCMMIDWWVGHTQICRYFKNNNREIRIPCSKEETDQEIMMVDVNRQSVIDYANDCKAVMLLWESNFLLILEFEDNS